MKIYKIYANCVTAANPIEEIDKETAHSLISDAVGSLFNNGEIDIDVVDEDDDDSFNEQYSKLVADAQKYFDDNGFFMCGDFIVEATDSPCRSDKYGYTDFT